MENRTWNTSDKFTPTPSCSYLQQCAQLSIKLGTSKQVKNLKPLSGQLASAQRVSGEPPNSLMRYFPSFPPGFLFPCILHAAYALQHDLFPTDAVLALLIFGSEPRRHSRAWFYLLRTLMPRAHCQAQEEIESQVKCSIQNALKIKTLAEMMGNTA